MTIDELIAKGECPDWLRLADTKDADVKIDTWGIVLWSRGNFLGGNFLGGKVNGKDAQRVLTVTACEGWPKTLCDVDGVAYVLAGCQFFTLAAAIEHWRNRPDRVMTFAMLAGVSEVAKLWGLKDGSS